MKNGEGKTAAQRKQVQEKPTQHEEAERKEAEKASMRGLFNILSKLRKKGQKHEN